MSKYWVWVDEGKKIKVEKPENKNFIAKFYNFYDGDWHFICQEEWKDLNEFIKHYDLNNWGKVV